MQLAFFCIFLCFSIFPKVAFFFAFKYTFEKKFWTFRYFLHFFAKFRLSGGGKWNLAKNLSKSVDSRFFCKKLKIFPFFEQSENVKVLSPRGCEFLKLHFFLHLLHCIFWPLKLHPPCNYEGLKDHPGVFLTHIEKMGHFFCPAGLPIFFLTRHGKGCPFFNPQVVFAFYSP